MQQIGRFVAYLFKMLRVLQVAVLLVGCSAQPTAQQQALVQTAMSIAQIAAQAAATYYGGPMAGAYASAGLSALAQTMQTYVGHTMPTSVVQSAPGVHMVGTAMKPIVPTNRVVTQADVDKLWTAAIIAKSVELKAKQ